MNFLRNLCGTLLLVCFAAPSARPQQPPDSPAQSSQPSSGEEKPRTSKDTRKRLEQLACGPANVHFSHHVLKQPDPLPQQPEDKSLIYVVRAKTPTGMTLQAKLGVDGKWVGVNGIGNYFYIELDPGPHYFCAQVVGQEFGLLSLVLDKGKTYFLRQEITMTGTDLELLDQDKGQQLVAKYHRSIFEQKTKKK